MPRRRQRRRLRLGQQTDWWQKIYWRRHNQFLPRSRVLQSCWFLKIQSALSLRLQHQLLQHQKPVVPHWRWVPGTTRDRHLLIPTWWRYGHMRNSLRLLKRHHSTVLEVFVVWVVPLPWRASSFSLRQHLDFVFPWANESCWDVAGWSLLWTQQHVSLKLVTCHMAWMRGRTWTFTKLLIRCTCFVATVRLRASC